MHGRAQQNAPDITNRKGTSKQETPTTTTTKVLGQCLFWMRRFFLYGGWTVLILVVLTVSLLYVEHYWAAFRSQHLLTWKRTEYGESSRTNNNFTLVGGYKILETLYHDPSAFTQGLLVAQHKGMVRMYESTGMYGRSDLRHIDLRSGRVLKRHKLPQQCFGEGIAHYRNGTALRLVQLTWQEQIAFEYDIHSHRVKEPLTNWTYETTTSEGWGITSAAGVFYVSDGSDYLHTWDIGTKRGVAKVKVHYQRPDMRDQRSIHYLNELEFDPVSNTVLANVLGEDLLIRINPQSGFVQTIYDLRSLFPLSQRKFGTGVMNGISLTYDSLEANSTIAGDHGTDEVWITGKSWPKMYRIRLLEPA